MKKKVVKKKAKKVAKPVVRPPREPKTAKEALAFLDRFMARADFRERELLWEILAAFRGPDLTSSFVKDRTTGPIRRRALPLSAKVYDLSGFNPASFHSHGYHTKDEVNAAHRNYYGANRSVPETTDHFWHHIESAWSALHRIDGRTPEELRADHVLKPIVPS